jgi:mono/diheme cytochrome c family protein
VKFLKIALVLSANLLFIIACNQTQTINTNITGNTAAVTNSNISIATPAPAEDELASARKIYSEQCVKCHKEDGTGGVSIINGKRIKAQNFTSDRQKKEPDSEYIEVIENGEEEDGMPAFKGKISDDDIKNLVKLIRKDFQGKQ